MRPELPEDLVSVDEPACSDISLRLAQSLVECRTVGFIEPVPGVKRQQLYFRSVWQIGRFVQDKSTFSDTSLDGHAKERSTDGGAQQALAAAGRAVRRSS